MCISACGDREPKQLQNLRLRGCNILIAFPQAELSLLDRIPARGKCKFLCAVGPARGDREPKWLQNLRLRRCKILITFPQAEVFILNRIIPRGGSVAKWLQNLHLRECKSLIAFPQAEVNRIPTRWECRNCIASPPFGSLSHSREWHYKNSDSAPVSHM